MNKLSLLLPISSLLLGSCALNFDFLNPDSKGSSNSSSSSSSSGSFSSSSASSQSNSTSSSSSSSSLTSSSSMLDNFIFEISDGEVSVRAKPSIIEGELIVPSSYNGYQVTSVAANGFEDFRYFTSIVLPDCLETIGESGFQDCEALESVTMHGVSTIEDYAFWGCYALETISTDSLVNIGSLSFWGCSALSDLSLPATVINIGEHAFADCDSLNSISYGGTISDWEDAYPFGVDGLSQREIDIHCSDGDTTAFI